MIIIMIIIIVIIIMIITIMIQRIILRSLPASAASTFLALRVVQSQSYAQARAKTALRVLGFRV